MSLADKISNAFVNFDIIDQMVSGDANTTVQTPSGPLPTLAKLEQDIVQRVAASLVAVSASTVAMTTGPKIFEIGAGKTFTLGQWITATSVQGTLSGVVASLVGGTLTVNVQQKIGTGSSNEWVIALSGPPGVAGLDGLPGVPGTAGVDGLPGANGLPGVKGDTGNPGIPGIPGENGTNGTPGVKGDTGNPGIQGIPGTPGINGTNGQAGTPGLQGLPGAQGIPGIQGPPGADGGAGGVAEELIAKLPWEV